MSREGQQTALMRQDGYVPAAEVARAIGIHITTAHKWIVEKKMPGGRFGWGWYVDIWDFVEKATKNKMFPEDGTAMKELKKLKMTVGRRATQQQKKAGRS